MRKILLYYNISSKEEVVLELNDIEEIKEKIDSVSVLFKSLSHPKRLLILCFLSSKEYSVHELEELCEIGQSQLSQFLRRMELEGILKSRKEGRMIFYQIADQKAQSLLEAMKNIFCAT